MDDAQIVAEMTQAIIFGQNHNHTDEEIAANILADLRAAGFEVVLADAMERK